MLVGDIGKLTPSILLAVIWITVSLAILCVLFRLTIRILYFKRVSIDDGLVYFALAVLVSMAVLYTLVTPTMFTLDAISLGKELPGPNLMEDGDFYLKCQFAIILLFWTCLWAVKVSILMFYKNLFVRLPTRMKLWWAVLAMVLILYLGCWGSQLASCAPVSSYFVLGACNSPRDVQASNDSLYISTGFDMASDVLVIIPLLCLLPGLQVNRKEKIALASVFSLSAIVIIVAIVRVIQTSATIQHVDPVWLALWSMIEASVAVMVACLPSFRILISKRNRSNVAYVYEPSGHGSSERDVFTHAKRPSVLCPIDMSTAETLTRSSGENFANAEHEERRPSDRDRDRSKLRPARSESSIPEGNVRVRNEFSVVSATKKPPIFSHDSVSEDVSGSCMTCLRAH